MTVAEQSFEFVTLLVSSFGTLTLAALGLVVIYGMMGVINFAHGEFIMIGAYGTTMAYNYAGVPLFLAVLVGGLCAGVCGFVLELLVVRKLYHREIDSMVATWAVSVILGQGSFVLLGSSLPGIGTPFGALRVGAFSAATYDFVLAGVALLLLVAMYLAFMYTDYGLQVRATMQDEATARSLGVDTPRMYRNTFFLGSFLAGLSGGLFAPTIAIVPNLGQQFIIKAFVTVIVGGSNVLLGTPASALSLSVVDSLATQRAGILVGQVALLVTTVLIIRVLPQGVSSYWEGTR